MRRWSHHETRREIRPSRMRKGSPPAGRSSSPPPARRQEDISRRGVQFGSYSVPFAASRARSIINIGLRPAKGPAEGKSGELESARHSRREHGAVAPRHGSRGTEPIRFALQRVPNPLDRHSPTLAPRPLSMPRARHGIDPDRAFIRRFRLPRAGAGSRRWRRLHPGSPSAGSRPPERPALTEWIVA